MSKEPIFLIACFIPGSIIQIPDYLFCETASPGTFPLRCGPGARAFREKGDKLFERADGNKLSHFYVIAAEPLNFAFRPLSEFLAPP